MTTQNKPNRSFTKKIYMAFDALKKREQYLLLVAVPVTITVVFFLLLIEPEMKASTKLKDKLGSLQNQLSLAKRSNEELLEQAQIDPNTEISQQIDSLQHRLERLNQEFQGELSQLVSPQVMPVLLEQLFNKAQGLSLINMQSVTPEKLILNRVVTQQDSSIAKSKETQHQAIYRHGIEITFAGSFFATRDFLTEAENLGWKLYWQDLSYKVDEYPDAITHLSLFTLSTSEAFIGVN